MLDRWQKISLGGLAVVGLGFAGFSGIQMNQPARSSSEVKVSVTGAVRKQGIVKISPGATIESAINAAGGALRGADLTSINLTEPVEEGMQIVLGKPDGVTESIPAESSILRRETRFNNAKQSEAPKLNGPVSLNNATQAELETLPKVGPALAGRIIQYRQQNGGFKSVEELNNVKGIGEKTMALLRPLVTL
jgi:competence protein ComEA